MRKSVFLTIFLLLCSLHFHEVQGADTQTSQSPIQCTQSASERLPLSYEMIYQNMPFQAGEKAVYKIWFIGLLAGHFFMEVKKPIKYNGNWHQHFYSEVKSDRSYESLFRINDSMTSYSDPVDFRISKFNFKQDERSLFSNRFRQVKHLEFDHKSCRVHEIVFKNEKVSKKQEFDLQYGAKDSLGMIFYLRTLPYEMGKQERTLVYSSKKNWWLEATPVAKETIVVSAGKFNTIKLKLLTYFGKELQQQGDVHVWIAESQNRPVVKIQGKLALGSLLFELMEYQEGRNVEMTETEEDLNTEKIN